MVPLYIFSYFKTNWSFTKAKGSPLSQFWALDIAPTLAVTGGFQIVFTQAVLFFSRRFMKWNATIIVTLSFFFNPLELTKIVLQNIIVPFGLTNWTKNVSPVFERNVPYRARPKRPPFQFFSALRDFFSENFSPKVPLQFFDVLRQNGCWKTPKGPPFQFFRIVRLFI